jgi:hypothetical protein
MRKIKLSVVACALVVLTAPAYAGIVASTPTPQPRCQPVQAPWVTPTPTPWLPKQLP